MSSNKIEIYQRKSQLILFLIATIFFLPFAIALLLRRNLFFVSLGTLLSLLFIVLIALIIRRLLQFKPVLTIDEKGIFDQTNHLRFPQIKWEEIAGIEETNLMSQSLILVKLYQPAEFINQENTKWQRVYRMSQEMYGTPESISASPLKIKHQELFQILKESFEKYGKSNH
ncbi:MAG: hypothetical protein LBI13_10480 [Streptococcaceae bacterium]|jgi:hypothetical protein|nr:hypothetical protein [Streptococcaceae bacterium]